MVHNKPLSFRSNADGRPQLDGKAHRGVTMPQRDHPF
jgi:hypothetical protein